MNPPKPAVEVVVVVVAGVAFVVVVRLNCAVVEERPRPKLGCAGVVPPVVADNGWPKPDIDGLVSGWPKPSVVPEVVVGMEDVPVKPNEDCDFVKAGVIPNEKPEEDVVVGAATVEVVAAVPNEKPVDVAAGAIGVLNGNPGVLATAGCAGVPNGNGLAGVDVIPKPLNGEAVVCADKPNPDVLKAPAAG